MLAVLSVLPPGIRDPRLHIPCSNPLPAALQRFRQLQQLSMAAQAGSMTWEGHGAGFLLRRLVHLELDCRHQPGWNGEYFEHAEMDSLPSSIAADLSPATRLSSLELRIRGAYRLLKLCRALPALRNLRWGGVV